MRKRPLPGETWLQTRFLDTQRARETLAIGTLAMGVTGFLLVVASIFLYR